MSKFSKKSRITLMLGMGAGLALLLGVLSIFEIPADTVTGVLVRLVAVVLAFMALAFVAATGLALIKRWLRKRQ